MKAVSVNSRQFSEAFAEAKAENRIDEILNLRGEKCPMNFVKTKLKLEEMQDGQNLQVIIDAEEAMQSIPRMIKEEGHKIIKVEKAGNENFSLLIKKDGGASNGG